MWTKMTSGQIIPWMSIHFKNYIFEKLIIKMLTKKICSCFRMWTSALMKAQSGKDLPTPRWERRNLNKEEVLNLEYRRYMYSVQKLNELWQAVAKSDKINGI